MKLLKTIFGYFCEFGSFYQKCYSLEQKQKIYIGKTYQLRDGVRIAECSNQRSSKFITINWNYWV